MNITSYPNFESRIKYYEILSSRQWWNQFNATLNFAKADARTIKTSSCLDNESMIASLLIHSYHLRFNISSVLR